MAAQSLLIGSLLLLALLSQCQATSRNMGMQDADSDARASSCTQKSCSSDSKPQAMIPNRKQLLDAVQMSGRDHERIVLGSEPALETQNSDLKRDLEAGMQMKGSHQKRGLIMGEESESGQLRDSDVLSESGLTRKTVHLTKDSERDQGITNSKSDKISTSSERMDFDPKKSWGEQTQLNNQEGATTATEPMQCNGEDCHTTPQTTKQGRKLRSVITPGESMDTQGDMQPSACIGADCSNHATDLQGMESHDSHGINSCSEGQCNGNRNPTAVKGADESPESTQMIEGSKKMSASHTDSSAKVDSDMGRDAERRLRESHSMGQSQTSMSASNKMRNSEKIPESMENSEFQRKQRESVKMSQSDRSSMWDSDKMMDQARGLPESMRNADAEGMQNSNSGMMTDQQHGPVDSNRMSGSTGRITQENRQGGESTMEPTSCQGRSCQTTNGVIHFGNAKQSDGSDASQQAIMDSGRISNRDAMATCMLNRGNCQPAEKTSASQTNSCTLNGADCQPTEVTDLEGMNPTHNPTCGGDEKFCDTPATVGDGINSNQDTKGQNDHELKGNMMNPTANQEMGKTERILFSSAGQTHKMTGTENSHLMNSKHNSIPEMAKPSAQGHAEDLQTRNALQIADSQLTGASGKNMGGPSCTAGASCHMAMDRQMTGNGVNGRGFETESRSQVVHTSLNGASMNAHIDKPKPIPDPTPSPSKSASSEDHTPGDVQTKTPDDLIIPPIGPPPISSQRGSESATSTARRGMMNDQQQMARSDSTMASNEMGLEARPPAIRKTVRVHA